MKKTILTLLVAIGSLISSAQDTIEVKNPIMYGVELGAPIEGRGLLIQTLQYRKGYLPNIILYIISR